MSGFVGETLELLKIPQMVKFVLHSWINATWPKVEYCSKFCIFLGSVLPPYVALWVGLWVGLWVCRRQNLYVLIGFQAANENH